jgi:hypothetical protein
MARSPQKNFFAGAYPLPARAKLSKNQMKGNILTVENFPGLKRFVGLKSILCQ